MPIPDDFQVSTASKKEFDLLPEDTYQVVISNIELKTDQPVYQKPDETEDKLAFEFTIVEEGMFKSRKLWLDIRPIMSAGGSVQPSWLYKIFCAVNQVQLNEDEAKGIASRTINEMEGKQLRLVVKQKPTKKGDLRNRITDVLPIKGQPIGEEVARPSVPPTVQIDDSDIPF